ncbi:unnamed protein product [Durusdinium trenchii]|uniref:Uncharacterized protein n=1 Tax=Durusdinium trenchii TaxID=1381693 RepID=A0ABP0HEF2_9DINO
MLPRHVPWRNCNFACLPCWVPTSSSRGRSSLVLNESSRKAISKALLLGGFLGVHSRRASGAQGRSDVPDELEVWRRAVARLKRPDSERAQTLAQRAAARAAAGLPAPRGDSANISTNCS